MKKLLAFLFIALFACSIVAGCTAQQRAKKYGGSAKIDLPPGKRLMEATWKGDDLWFLVRDREENERPRSYVFSESSSWGMFEGQIVFHER